MQIQNIIGGELGSNKVIISRLQRSRVEAILSESSNIEIPHMIGFTEKERNYAEQCLVKLKRNYKTSVVQLTNIFGDFEQSEAQHQKAKVENRNGRFYFPDLKLQRKENQNKNSMEIENEQQNQDGNQQGLKPEQVLAGYVSYIDSLISKNTRIQNYHLYAIFSVPSYYTPVMKKQVESSFKIVDFPLMKVIEEHIAISTTYLQLKRKDLQEQEGNRNIVFIDIGYSKSNIFITQFTKDGAQVIYVDCQRGLGIRTLDNILYEKIGNTFKEKHGEFPFENVKTKLRVLESVEKNRKILSTNADTTIDIECLVDDEDFSMNLTREEYEKLIKSQFLSKLEEQLKKAQKFINKQKDFNSYNFEIEILGGGVRIPSVKKLIQDTFPKIEKLGVSLQVESLSRGCTYQCAQLASLFNPLIKVENYQVNGCTVYDYVIKTFVGEKVVREDKISKNSPLPFNYQQVVDFTEFENEQNLEVSMQLFIGNSLISTTVLMENKDKRQKNSIQVKQEQKQENQEQKQENQENKMEEEVQQEKQENEKKEENKNKMEEEKEIQEKFQFITIQPDEESEIENQKEKQNIMKIVYCLNEDQQLEIRQSSQVYSYINRKDQLVEITTPYYSRQHWEQQISEQEIQEFKILEKQQRQVDLEIQSLQELRNKFEKKIYENQRLINEEFKLKLQPQDLESLQKKLQEVQSWFDENGFQTTDLSILQNHFDDLEKFFNPFIESLKMDDLMTVEVKSADNLKSLNGQTLNGLNLNLRNQELGDGQGFFGMFQKGAFKIAELLKSVKVHQKLILDIGNCKITDAGAKQLFKSASCQRNLLNLKVDMESSDENVLKNYLTVECLHSLQDLIKSQLSTLEVFSLCINKIYDEEFHSLMGVILELPKLKSLTLEIKKGELSQKVRQEYSEKIQKEGKIMKFELKYFNKQGVKENI